VAAIFNLHPADIAARAGFGGRQSAVVPDQGSTQRPGFGSPKRARRYSVNGTLQLAFRGYCPVTYVQSYKRFEGLQLGRREFLVHFCDAYYALRGQQEVSAPRQGPRI
jgi:hypothetical protein